VAQRLPELDIFEAFFDVSPVGGYVRLGLLGAGIPCSAGGEHC
jgi:hypothetical protein